MDAFSATASKPNFTMKLWRGERMCLIGFDVGAPEPDLVGFAGTPGCADDPTPQSRHESDPCIERHDFLLHR